MNSAEYVAMEMSSAPLNTNVGLKCPYCGHDTLSALKRPGGQILWHCWRAGCGVAGSTHGAFSFQSEQNGVTPPENERLTPFRGPIRHISWQEADKLAARFGISANYIIPRVMASGGHYILPIYDPTGKVRGVVKRRPWVETELAAIHCVGPKSQIFKEKHEPMIAWYGQGALVAQHIHVILVEDQLSAIKLAGLGYRACALLGTDLNIEKVEEIAKQGGHVSLALDADATGKAFSLARKWQAAFASFQVKILTRDVKDLSDEDIKAKFA